MLRRQPRADAKVDYVVVGLGNPGRQYEGTRHNVGADTVLALARRHGAQLSRYLKVANVGEVTIDGRRVALAVPLTYMNDSGQAVAPLVKRYAIAPEQLVIVQDELDLPQALVRVKDGGGLAGHNGLRSIESHVKTRDFLRVRIGIGKPPDPRRGADHVLKNFSKRDREEIDIAVETAADAVEAIVREGVEAAMTKFNARA